MYGNIVYLTIELRDFEDKKLILLNVAFCLILFVFVLYECFGFFIMQVVTSQIKMKILDAVILLLSVVNAQSKYVVCNRLNNNRYRKLFSLIRLHSPIWESVEQYKQITIQIHNILPAKCRLDREKKEENWTTQHDRLKRSQYDNVAHTTKCRVQIIVSRMKPIRG